MHRLGEELIHGLADLGVADLHALVVEVLANLTKNVIVALFE